MLTPTETMTQNGVRKFRVLVPELDYGELLSREVGYLNYPPDWGPSSSSWPCGAPASR